MHTTGAPLYAVPSTKGNRINLLISPLFHPNGSMVRSTVTSSLPGQWLKPLILVTLFVTLGCLVLPYPGIQNDEALFAGGIYDKQGIADRSEERRVGKECRL